MPCYDWKCKSCGTEIEVIRRVSDSHVPPEGDEITCDCCTEGAEGEDDDRWEKIITHAVPAVRLPGWGTGSKGNW